MVTRKASSTTIQQKQRRIVKEIARLGGDVTDFVPARVARALTKKLKL